MSGKVDLEKRSEGLIRHSEQGVFNRRMWSVVDDIGFKVRTVTAGAQRTPLSRGKTDAKEKGRNVKNVEEKRKRCLRQPFEKVFIPQNCVLAQALKSGAKLLGSGRVRGQLTRWCTPATWVLVA